MATISRQKDPRSTRIWATGTAGEYNRDDVAGGPITLSATTYSLPLYAPTKGGRGSIHIAWGAGLTGSFSIQYTLNPYPELTTDADWVTDTGVTVTGSSFTVAGAAGAAIVFIGNILPEWVRIKWTHSSGSGTVQGWQRMENVL